MPQAALRMLDHRKLSSKINYSVLAELFEDGEKGGEEGEDGARRPHPLGSGPCLLSTLHALPAHAGLARGAQGLC